MPLFSRQRRPAISCPARLNVLALACGSQRQAVAQAAGVEPLCFPPCGLETFNPGWLDGRDFLFIALHGIPTQAYLYGDGYATGPHVSAFQHLDLSTTVVFAASCYFDRTPFLQTVLDCNPRALIAGQGHNFARNQTLVGTYLLGFYVRTLLEHTPNADPSWILTSAQIMLKSHTALLQKGSRRRRREDAQATADALEFTIYT